MITKHLRPIHLKRMYDCILNTEINSIEKGWMLKVLRIEIEAQQNKKRGLE